MNGPHAHKFGVVYGLLAFVLLVAAYGAVKGLTYHAPPPDPTVAHKAQLTAVAGNQDLVYQCEANITSSIKSNGGQVRGYTKPQVKPAGPDKVKVSVSVGSDVYSGRLTCTFQKSNWNLQQVTPA